MKLKLAALGLTAVLAFAPAIAMAEDTTPAATPAAEATAKPMKHKAKSHKATSHKAKSHKMKKKAPEAEPTPTPSAT